MRACCSMRCGTKGSRCRPQGKLPDSVIGDFERWVKMGAPDPRRGGPSPSPVPARGGINVDAGRKFWAYQPPRRREPPSVRDAAWPATDIDRFLLVGSRSAKHPPYSTKPTAQRWRGDSRLT